MKVIIPIFIILSISSFCFSSELKYLERIEFEKPFISSCIKNQKEDKLSNNFEDWQIEQYCDCTARRVSSDIKKNEIKYLIKNKNMPKSLYEKIKKSGSICLSELMVEWGYPQ